MTEHSDEMGCRAADQYELGRRRHMEVIAAIRAIEEPEADRVVHRLSRVIHRLTTAINAELRPYVALSPDELRGSRPRQ